MKFLETIRGAVSVAHVRSIEERYRTMPGGNRERYFIALTDDGHHHELSYRFHSLFDLVMPTSVLPATQPMTLVGIWPQAGDQEPIIERLPVIGWTLKHDPGWPYPIAVGCGDLAFDDENSRAHYFIELPQGGFQQVGYEADSFKTLDECIEAAKQRLKS